MALILFGSLIIFFLLKVPIAFSLILSSLLVMLLTGTGLEMIPKRLFTSCDSFSFMAVPFFLLAGSLMSQGGISERLCTFINSVFGRFPGGLGIVAIIACAFFAAISGSGAATTAAIGGMMIPEMVKHGYDRNFSAATSASGGCIGTIIPPSIPFVTYGVLTGCSVSTLFMAGFIPGILMGIALIAIALVQAYQDNYPKGSGFSLKNVGKTFLKAIPGILMPLIILGGIFSGYFTPSEAAAVAVVYAVLVSAFIYRDLTLKGLYEIMKGSARTSAVIMIIIACSGPFGWVLANWKIPETIASSVLSISQSKYVIMMLISVIILIAGVFMETSSAIIILTPVFLPLIKALGVSTLHFGILFVVGIAIGMITPPVAINLFVATGISGLPIEKIAKAVVPYLIGLIVVFLMIVFVPLLIPGLL
ncbi:MAG: TRAP transporter large permease [Clostridia bacterium]|nr:TRAP transporter large permease [Clostridia bacterium]